MRRFSAIVRATALEICSEPLALLLTMSATALAFLAPRLHYHQFGDPTRMARDAGFSALFTCGSVIAVFCTIRSFRREVETGTMEMALAHPISRPGFFLAKTFGAFCAYLVLAAVVLGTTAVMFHGAAVGGEVARRTGDIARIFWPHLVAAVSVAAVPLVVGAALNRFARCRFVLSAVLLSFALATSGAAVVFWMAGAFVLRLLPVAALLVLLSSVLLTAAAALSVRLKANAAAAGTGVVALLLVPAVGNYYLADALSGGGSLPWSYVAWAAAATLPAVVAFLLLGAHLINGRDIQWTL